MHQVELYSRSNELQRDHAARVLREYVPRMSWSCEETAGAQAAALDVGSGTGDVTAQLLLPLLPDSVRLLVGADVSADMVRHAAAAAASSIPRLRFLQTDIAAPDISATPLGQQAEALGGFCKVFSFYALHWVLDQRTALSNIHDLLRPGGEGLILLVAFSPVYNAYRTLRRLPQWSRYMMDIEPFISPYHRTSDPEGDFTTALKHAGFEVLQSHWQMVTHHYPSPQSLRDAMTALNPFMKDVPEEQKSPFILAFLREFEIEQAGLVPAIDGGGNTTNSDFNFFQLVAHVKKH